ncbi:MAG: SRPBCC family protein [Proteobacteria bacterium]|jgi:uncharacterized protein YndB with AHSA1/START domain|nr:SRPBCC family protein [Pseudomonadota bacterium]
MWFDLKPCGPEWGKDAPFFFENTRILSATPARVFDVLMDATSWPQWFPDMEDVEYTTPPPVGVGSKRIVTLRGQRLEEVFTVFEPGKRWAFYVERSTVPLTSHFQEDYRLEAVGEGQTRLDWYVYFRPHRPLHLLRRAISPMLDKMFREGMTNLDDYLKG